MTGPSTDPVVAQLAAMYARFEPQSLRRSLPSGTTSNHRTPLETTQQTNAINAPCITAIQQGQPSTTSSLLDMVHSYCATTTAIAGRTTAQPLEPTPCTAGNIGFLQPSIDGRLPLPADINHPLQPVSLSSANPTFPPITAPMAVPADDHPDYFPLLMAAMSSSVPPASAAPAAFPAAVAAANSSTSTNASSAPGASHPDIMNSSFSFDQGLLMGPTTRILQGNHQNLQEWSSSALPAAQHLQLNGTQLHDRPQSTAIQGSSTMLNLSHLLATTDQQHGLSCVAPSTSVSMAGQLRLNQLAAAGAFPGATSALSTLPLHSAAMAQQQAAVRQLTVSAAMAQATKSTIPDRHAYRSDGSINTLYKTQICRTWATTGYCKYEERCQFAHGESDLRGVHRPAKYKTVLCRNTKLFGFCPFGERCNFIHEEDSVPGTPTSSSTAGSATLSSFAGAGSSQVSSRRSSGCEGFMPAAATAYGSFAGQPSALSRLARELQCNQLAAPANLNNDNLAAWCLGADYLAAADLALAGNALTWGMTPKMNPYMAGNDLISGLLGPTGTDLADMIRMSPLY